MDAIFSLAEVQVFATVVLAILTGVLAKSTYDYAQETKKQSKIMGEQTSAMDNQLKHDRLVKRHNRLLDEMNDFVGILYGRRYDKQIFSFEKIEEIYKGTPYVPENQMMQIKKQYAEFWDKISRYQYLNQSSELGEMLVEYWKVTDKEEPADYPGTRERIRKIIERRYNELSDEIKSVEKELKLLGEERF